MRSSPVVPTLTDVSSSYDDQARCQRVAVDSPVGSDTTAVSIVSYVTDNNPDLK